MQRNFHGGTILIENAKLVTCNRFRQKKPVCKDYLREQGVIFAKRDLVELLNEKI